MKTYLHQNVMCHEMAIYKYLTWPLGVWPLQSYNVFSLVRWITVSLVEIIFICVIGSEVYRGCTDTIRNLDTIMLCSCLMNGLVKMTSYRIYHKKLLCVFESAVDDFSSMGSKESREIMRKHVDMGKTMCYSLLSFCYISCLFIVTTPFFSLKSVYADKSNTTYDTYRMRILPLPTECTLSKIIFSTNAYIITYGIQSISTFIGGTANVGTDVLIFGIVCHVSGQAQILKREFIHFGGQKEENEQKLTVLINRHRHILMLAGYIGYTISFALMVQLFFGCVLISTMGLHLLVAVKTEDYVMAFKVTALLGTFMVQMYAYSYVGDYMKCQIEEVGDAAYECLWYNLPLVYHKNLIFVMMRSQRPVQIAAGHFFPINLKSFTVILKTSLSYLSVLRIMLDT